MTPDPRLHWQSPPPVAGPAPGTASPSLWLSAVQALRSMTGATGPAPRPEAGAAFLAQPPPPPLPPAGPAAAAPAPRVSFAGSFHGGDLSHRPTLLLRRVSTTATMAAEGPRFPLDSALPDDPDPLAPRALTAGDDIFLDLEIDSDNGEEDDPTLASPHPLGAPSPAAADPGAPPPGPARVPSLAGTRDRVQLPRGPPAASPPPEPALPLAPPAGPPPPPPPPAASPLAQAVQHHAGRSRVPSAAPVPRAGWTFEAPQLPRAAPRTFSFFRNSPAGATDLTASDGRAWAPWRGAPGDAWLVEDTTDNHDPRA